MKKEAKKLLREELKAKGLTTVQIDEMFRSWNEEVKETVESNKEDADDEDDDKASIRHGTTCIGIITKKKTLTEF